MKNILVISHRRSGTHLTVDSLINNFDFLSNVKNAKNLSLDALFGAANDADIRTFLGSFEAGGRVVKTHSTFDYWNHFSTYSRYKPIIDAVFDCPCKVYVYRGGLDVMVSLYRYQKSFSDRVKGMSFYDFLREPVSININRERRVVSKPAYWAYHLRGWVFRENILILKFNDLKNDFYGTVRRLASLLGEAVPAEAKNVGMEKLRDGRLLKATSESVNRTSVSFYGGRIGDYKELFRPSDVTFFEEEVASVSVDLLGFCE